MRRLRVSGGAVEAPGQAMNESSKTREIGPAPDSLLRWERGYRCHGLWRGDQRVGLVGIASQADGGARRGYHWSIDGTGRHGTVRTLRAAKKAVERLIR